MVLSKKDYYDPETLGESLKKRREELGISQEALAFVAGISIPFLCTVEQGKKIPSVKVLNKLLYALNVKVIFEGQEGLKPDIAKLIQKFEKEMRVLRQSMKSLDSLKNGII